MIKKIVPDTSILVQRKLSEIIIKKKLKNLKIIVPKAVVDELQAQASRGRDIGFKGLEEIKKIRKIGKNKNIKIEFTGKRPSLEEIQLAKKGRIDALIRDVAKKEDAKLITADYVQALIAEVEGIEVEYIPKKIIKKINLENFFSKDTQSVHLKVDVPPLAKIGKPGNVKLIKLRKSVCTEAEIKEIIRQVIDKMRTRRKSSFIEIGRGGGRALVIQLDDYRISIAYPPFSDDLELTAVRPIAKVTLDDYKLHEELKKRLVERAEGILVAGPPGSGKTSFASAVAEFLYKRGKIVKTFEKPRDLQVGPEITQYAPLNGSWDKTAELLLLVRPDYTIFDEIRKTADFKVFSDMRLSGVGMVGVVHSTTPVAAIQRFIFRLELGMVPHVIDTVIFIKDGKIEKVYELGLTVKIPGGMKEEDLARPVVEIRDFASKKLEYEIYTFGEENIIMPVQKEKISAIKELAMKKIQHELARFDPNVKVEFLGEDRVVAKVRNDVIARIIGKKGKNIEKIEKKLGIHISVEPIESTLKGATSFDFEEKGTYINLRVSKGLVGKQVDVHKGDEYIFSPFVGKNGVIRVKKSSELGRKIISALALDNLRILV